MGNFRCKSCHQLQFKHRIRGDKVEIEIKCYNCNTYSYFTIWLSSLLKQKDNLKTKNEKDSQHIEQKIDISKI